MEERKEGKKGRREGRKEICFKALASTAGCDERVSVCTLTARSPQAESLVSPTPLESKLVLGNHSGNGVMLMIYPLT